MAAKLRNTLSRSTHRAIAVAMTAVALSVTGCLNQQSRLPNILIVFTDDQGYADVGVFGARGFETPNIDRLAQQGMRFTSFYVAQPVCSASRAALLTGCYPNRIGIHGALMPNSKNGIRKREVTLAELCRSKGYATAIYGKWHLGDRPRFLPTRHGFDEFYGIPYSNDMWPLHPSIVNLPPDVAERKSRYPDLPIFENEQVVVPRVTPDDQARLTSELTDRAVDFISRNKDQPFFLYVPYPMPHVPLFTSQEFVGKSTQGVYGDVMMEIDFSVGRILAALRTHGLEEHTLVIFTSDNGPWLSYGNHAGSVGPLREGKGTTYEGGVRVPCIMRWPGRIPEAAVCDEPAMTIDIFPTVARLIGAQLPEHKIDGKDIGPLMFGEPNAKSPHEALYFYYQKNALEAVRSGKWKLVLPRTYRSLTGEPGNDGTQAGYTYPTNELELFDLSKDIGERNNVFDQHPQVVAKLMQHVEAARQDLGDSLVDRVGENPSSPRRSRR